MTLLGLVSIEFPIILGSVGLSQIVWQVIHVFDGNYNAPTVDLVNTPKSIQCICLKQ